MLADANQKYPTAMRVNTQEVNLMLIGRIGRVRARLLHTEMIVQAPASQIDTRLGDQFSPPHVRVPESCRVYRDLDTLAGSCIGWVLECGREVDIFVHCPSTMDVVLVGANLTGPRPFVKVRTCRVITIHN